jgi:peptide-methionine (S)-S-oxide reductase
VIRTRVGYTGGTTRNPTYHDLGDHTETVQLDYDPQVVSYEELVKVFFASHTPTCAATSSRQYMSAIFFHTADQERVARQVKAQEEERTGAALQTEILPASDFYLAEDYHQKYALQNDSILMYDFRRMYPDLTDIVNSTAATRVNAYLYRCGSLEQLRAELDDLGLSAAGRAYLLELLGG